MMRFNQYTTIERHRRKGFPNLLFRIKPIHELLAGKVEEKLLIVLIIHSLQWLSAQFEICMKGLRLTVSVSQSKMQVPVEFEQLRNKSMESESGDEAISPIVQANLKLKGVATDQDEVDTGAIKRCLLDQFSSSQNLKKCKALVIKEEKTL
nr:uncharacterized protein LOC109190530 [Ipomoea batatas]